MITTALYKYLTGTEPIEGFPAQDFRAPAVFAGLSVPNREVARRLFKDRVGKEIYPGSVPRDGSQNIALTFQRISTSRIAETTGSNDVATAVIQVDIWTKGGKDPAIRGEVAANLLRLCVEGFGADFWGDVEVADCEVVREADFAIKPAQGSRWNYRYSMDLAVMYKQPAAVV